MVTVEAFELGVIPSKLYHLTPIKNLKSIEENGLIHNISEDKKQFNYCESAVYMFPRVNLAEDVLDLFYDAVANKFENIDDVEDIVEKYVLLSIDCDGLNKDKIGLDEVFVRKDTEEIVSYTYEDTISPKFIKVESYIEKLYHKEFLEDAWNYKAFWREME